MLCSTIADSVALEIAVHCCNGGFPLCLLIQQREKEAAIAQLKKEVNEEDYMQKLYLTLYNAVQFILFFIILMACTVGRVMRGPGDHCVVQQSFASCYAWQFIKLFSRRTQCAQTLER